MNEVKKILPWIIGFLGILILTGCGGNSIKDTLTADGGQWEGEGFGVSTKLTFYDDNQINVTENSSSYGGSYKYDEKDNKLTITLEGISTTILTDVKEKNGSITAKNGEKDVSFTKINQK